MEPGGGGLDGDFPKAPLRLLRRPSRAVVSLLVTVALLIATGLYNNAAAPQPARQTFAEVIPLGAGDSASSALRIEIQSPRPVVGSHYVLDPDAGLLHPIGGGAPTRPFPREPGTLEAVADRDNFAWVWRNEGTTSVTYFDQGLGTQRRLEIPEANVPLPGSLVAGGGNVAWTYARSDGRLALALFNATDLTLRLFPGGPGENRTAAAVLGPDLFFTKASDRSDLWLLNTTREREEMLAQGPGVGTAAAGLFFVAWINSSAIRGEYFDVYNRVVAPIPPPAEVTPKWVLADDLTVLMGGTKPGFFSASPRVLLYDFGTANSHIYESIGVDFDTSEFFAYGDLTVVSLVHETPKRPAAPYTLPLLAATLAATAVTVLVAAKDIFREGEDL